MMVMVVRFLDDDLAVVVMVAALDDDLRVVMVVVVLRQLNPASGLLHARGIVGHEQLGRIARRAE